MERKLIITKAQGILIAAVTENGKVAELHPLSPDMCHVDDIYMGTIVKKVAAQNAFYVDIGKRTLCYLDAGKSAARSLTCGLHLPVMIKKEAAGLKKALASPVISLKGMYCIVSTSPAGISFSRRLSAESCQRIRTWMEEAEYPAKGLHILVRTAAAECPRESFFTELDLLAGKLWDLLHAPAGNPRLLYRPSLYGIEYLQRISDCTDAEIVTDQETVYRELAQILESPQSLYAYRLRLYQDHRLSLDVLYHISKYIKEALQEKVWLRSGGFLVIQKTEALTAIDVNTGKAVQGKDHAAVMLHTNKEAALETARQLRLRNISGTILIDFINLKEEQQREEFHAILREALAKDPVPAEMIDETKLQLVEVVRKRQEPSFSEMISRIRS